MFCVGSLMSQVLQCTQFCELICRRLLPSSFATISYACWAVTLFRLVPFNQVHIHGNAGIFEFQVAGLVFCMVDVAQEYRVQLGERQLAIRFGVVNLLLSEASFKGAVVCGGVVQSHRGGEDIVVEVVERTTQIGSNLCMAGPKLRL